MAITRRDFLSLAVPATALAFGRDSSAQAPADIAVIVHPANRESSLDVDTLAAIFTTTQVYWPSGGRIVAFNLPPRTPPRVEFDRVVLSMGPDEVGRYWVDRRVRGGAPPPRQVPDPAVLVRVIARIEGGIGYVPASMVDAGVRVIANIRGGKVTR
jgi:hypothetical protein